MEPLQLVTLILTFIGVLVIGFAKYYERKVTAGETWSDAKFGGFFLVALIVMVFEYFATGGMAFPGEETITPILAVLTPIFGLFGATYSTLIGARLVNKKVLQPVIVSIKTPAVPETPAQPIPAPVPRPVDRDWLTFDATPENKVIILKQVDAAESAGLWTYRVTFTGGYYVIENGQLISSAGNPSGK
jgi:Zn-dependent protease with chaperone function